MYCFVVLLDSTKVIWEEGWLMWLSRRSMTLKLFLSVAMCQAWYVLLQEVVHIIWISW